MLGLLFFAARLRTQYKTLYWVHEGKLFMNNVMQNINRMYAKNFQISFQQFLIHF